MHGAACELNIGPEWGISRIEDIQWEIGLVIVRVSPSPFSLYACKAGGPNAPKILALPERGEGGGFVEC